jgi:phage-related holin
MSKLLNYTTAMTLILLFVPFLEKWVWSPFWTLIIFMLVVLLDFITAVAASWNEKKFVTSKAIKVPFTLVAYFILFAILHSLGKIVEAFEMNNILNPVAFKFLAISTYFLCFAINLLSALKHMSKLGLIPHAVERYISKFIDVHKNKFDQELTKEVPGSQNIKQDIL